MPRAYMPPNYKERKVDPGVALLRCILGDKTQDLLDLVRADNAHRTLSAAEHEKAQEALAWFEGDRPEGHYFRLPVPFQELCRLLELPAKNILGAIYARLNDEAGRNRFRISPDRFTKNGEATTVKYS